MYIDNDADWMDEKNYKMLKDWSSTIEDPVHK
jgi:hypothetical protein